MLLVHGKNGIWIIHGGSGKITVCSSTFYGVNSNFSCRHSKNYIYIKITGTNSNFYILQKWKSSVLHFASKWSKVKNKKVKSQKSKVKSQNTKDNFESQQLEVKSQKTKLKVKG